MLARLLTALALCAQPGFAAPTGLFEDPTVEQCRAARFPFQPEGPPKVLDLLGDLRRQGDPARLATPVVPSRVESPPLSTLTPLSPEEYVLARARRESGKLWVRHEGKDRALTLVPSLQDRLTTMLRSYDVPYGAVVALDPNTGRVLAMAEHSKAAPDLRGLALKAAFPAASVFKLVTAAALLRAGVPKDEVECYHGGKRRLSERLLRDSERDSQCVTLSRALALSANVVFGKLTLKHLSAGALRTAAAAFRFNRPLSFPLPVDTSLVAIPDEGFPLASTGAGFGDAFLSPLHGALIAAVPANGGIWRAPVLFEDEEPAEAPTRVLSEEEARALADMMEETVTSGTARRVFRERGYRVKGAVGKTGALADRKPFRDYSWFVGYAPKEDPKVAVAAVVVNDMRWRIRATLVAREAMRLYLDPTAVPPSGDWTSGAQDDG